MNIADHVARYSEDLALIRLTMAQVSKEDPIIIDLIQVETMITANMAKAARVQSENITISAINELVDATIGGIEAVAGLAFNKAQYHLAEPTINQEINNYLETLSTLRNLLIALVETDGFKGREVRRLMTLIIKNETGLYFSLVENNLTLPDKEANRAIQQALATFFIDLRAAITDDDGLFVVAQLASGNDPLDSFYSHDDNRGRFLLDKLNEAKTKGPTVDWPQLIEAVDSGLDEYNEIRAKENMARFNTRLYGTPQT